MKARSTFMVCAATMLGFLLGALCTHQTTVKAQSGIQVYVVKRDASDMAKKGPTPRSWQRDSGVFMHELGRPDGSASGLLYRLRKIAARQQGRRRAHDCPPSSVCAV